jgi:type IV pilus assembly protein PilC
MFSSSLLPLSSLIEMCRVLRHSLGAGLTLRDVFRQLATRGPHAARPICERIRLCLEQGDNLASALEREQTAFPPLFLSLAGVGEQTGHLPEVFGELERYYRLQQQLRRQFRAQILPTVIQFFLATFIIAGMLFVIGLVNQSRGGNVFGVRGPAAAGWFLIIVFGILITLYLVYRTLTRSLEHKAAVDALLLRVPKVGPCLEALALGRLAMALQLTLDSAMPIGKALRLSLRATGNAAYAARADEVAKAVRSGDDLTTALGRTHLLPEEFVNVLAVAEESGQIPEVMRRQMENYHEEAERRLRTLARAASGAVWLIYAGMITFAIFRIASVYISAVGG